MNDTQDNPPSDAPPPGTRDRLVAAAAEEFNSSGFHGTDTNRIARRAGFAPQTFYRHFADKTAIFIEVYHHWQAADRQAIVQVIRGGSNAADRVQKIADALLASHAAWRVFRRSLRLQALEDDQIRAARAASRRLQLELLLGRSAVPAPWADRVRALLVVERLCDAAADQETDDLDVDPGDWRLQVMRALEQLRDPARAHDGGGTTT
jgi:AcrR family transcriptional regulator